jgi:O-antigen/teichoic acid export membrane protein
MSATGFYNMAWQLIIFPLSRINPIVNTVAFPTYAKLQDDPETGSRYYSISVKFLSLVTLPLLSFLFFFASEVVWLVFGPGWEQTAILVRILAIVGVGKALGNPGGALILSMGRADVGFWWNVAWAVILTIGMVTALLLWPTVESAAYSLLGLSLTVGMFWHVLIARIGKLHYRPILLYFAKVFLATFVIGGISKLIVEMVALNQVIPQVALALSVFVLLYSIYLALVEREFLMRVIQS